MQRDGVKEAHKEKCILAPHLLQFSLEVLHILLRKLTFYKGRKSTWPTMKNALFDRYTLTNVINKMSMPCANGDASFYNKVAATNSNNNFIWSVIT